MALILADGFDFYTSATDGQYVGSPWTQAFNSSSTTPYGVGQSASVVGNGITAQFTNDTTIYFAFSIFTSSTFTSGVNQGFKIYVQDGSAVQCVLSWSQDGNFYIQPTAWSDTPIAGISFAHGMAANSWCHWQVKLVINNTTGSIELRKNNNPESDYVKTGINTRNGSANNYANKYQFMIVAPAYLLDDLFMCSGTGAAPNTWPGQLRAVQLMANGDVQKTMVPSAGANIVVGDSGTASGPFSISANTIMFPATDYGRVVTGVAGRATKITVKFVAGFTGKVRCALYSAPGNVPTTFIAETVEVTNPVTGDNDFTFSTPPTLVTSGVYCLGWWSDTAHQVYNAGGIINVRTQALSYVNSWPTTVATSTGGNGGVTIRVTIEPANYGMVDEPKMNSDTDYVYSANPGDLDIYSLNDLAVNPASIPLVVAKVAMKKSDTGARTACSQIKSGVSTIDQPAMNLAVTYGWQMTYLPTDPSTTAAWTQAGVNNLQLGVKVVA